MNLTEEQLPKNPLIKSVLEMIPGDGPVTPEHIIFGFAKLFSMDEVQIDIIIPSISLKEIYEIKEKFNSYNFNCELIKNTFSFYVQNAERFGKEIGNWNTFVRRGVAIKINAMELFQEALDCTYVVMSDYKNDSGLTMLDIFELQQAMLSKSEASSSKSSDIDWDGIFERQEDEKKENDDDKEIDELIKFLSQLEAEEEKTEAEEKIEESKSEEEDAPPVEEPKKEPISLQGISKKYQDITLKIFENVKGQDNAVMKFVRGIYRGEMQKGSKTRAPLASFFFVGPSGTGKTFLAQCGAEALGYAKDECLFLNMSEYALASDVPNLVGTSPGYNGGDKTKNDGTLTKFLLEHLYTAKEKGKDRDRQPIYEYSKKENGRCIVVLDEVEKASPEVLKTFLPILGQGVCHDVFRQKDIDCGNAIFIFTSNLGKELYDSTTAPLTTLPDKVVANAIGSQINQRTGEPYLPPELVSRLAAGNMIMFNHLSISNLVKIARDSMERISVQLCKNLHCKIKVAEDLPAFFLFTRGSSIDARVASNSGSSFISNEVYEFIRQIGQEGIDSNINSIEFNIDINSMNDEMKKLFVREGKTQILIIANKDAKEVLTPNDDKIDVRFASTYFDAIKLYEEMDDPIVFIDPETGYSEDDDDVLSVTDYNSDGVKVFRKLIEDGDAPTIFILNKDEFLSDTDAETFIQLGASDIINYSTEKEA
ncbi:MAG: AAA family ATPase, partial [Bacilli bacterium]|nr:AAA family ATPase [Bacilli bacterium]